MLEFFKTFGQGLLYVIISPFLLAIFSIYLVYAIVTYFILEICSIFWFFSGRNINSEDDETRELLKIQNDIATAKGIAGAATILPDNPELQANTAQIISKKEEVSSDDDDKSSSD